MHDDQHERRSSPAVLNGERAKIAGKQLDRMRGGQRRGCWLPAHGCSSALGIRPVSEARQSGCRAHREDIAVKRERLPTRRISTLAEAVGADVFLGVADTLTSSAR